MDIKKTDIFSGIGVFIIQMIANGIWYALQKDKIYLVIGILFAIIVSMLVVIIVRLKRKLRMQENSFMQQIENLGVDELKKEKDELIENVNFLKSKIDNVENERDSIDQEISDLENEIELLKNKCEYYTNTTSIHRKILYLLKMRKKYENAEIQSLIGEVEYIFRDNVFSKNAKINTSIF